MFKTKFVLLTEDWKIVHLYRSRIKPDVGEFIYIKDDNVYYKVIRVIHNVKYGQVILIVEKVVNELVSNGKKE